MKFLAKLTMLGLIAAIGFTGTSSASMMKHKMSMMPVCKSPVVYAVPMRKMYYVRGETMYGHAKGGTYMCMAAANGHGYKKM